MQKQNHKNYIFISLLFLLAILSFTGCKKRNLIQSDSWDESISSQTQESSQEKQTENQTIYVHVCGAVKQEGVYELPTNSRIFEAIEAAGGLKKDAADDSLNQAQILEDGMQIYIPTKKEVKAKEDGTQSGNDAASGGKTKSVADTDSKKVNLNTATKEELLTLTGIGETRAEQIIQYRSQNGFSKIEDIMQVEGIKEGIFNKIKDQITVS